MSDKLAQLRLQREELVARAQLQRVGFKNTFQPLRQPLARVDQVVAAIGYLKRHPALLVGAGALLLILRRGPAGKWLGRGWLAWRTFEGLRSSLAGPGHRLSAPD